MLFPIASRPAARWIIVAILAGLGAGFYFQDREETCSCQDPAFQEVMYKLERESRFFAILHDRADRWLLEHPDRSCPRIEDIATYRELVQHNYKTIEFVCGDRQYFGRRVVVTTTKPLVHWPSIRLFQ